MAEPSQWGLCLREGQGSREDSTIHMDLSTPLYQYPGLKDAVGSDWSTNSTRLVPVASIPSHPLYPPKGGHLLR